MNLSELKEMLNQLVDPSNEMTIGETESLKHISYDEEKDLVTLKVAMGRLGGENEKKFRRDIARIVKYHQPKIILLENVKNLKAHNGGATFEVISNTLNEMNYNIYYKVLNAKNYCLPQNRERIAIVCIRKDIDTGKFEFPQEEKKFINISDIKEDDTVTEKYIIRRNDIKIDQSKLDKAIKQGRVNKPVQIGIIGKGGQGNRIYHENGIGITLAASSGGAASKTGAYYINGKVRKLSPREAARLQGFPEDFIIINNENQALKQFGNSVPINLLKAVFSGLKNL